MSEVDGAQDPQQHVHHQPDHHHVVRQRLQQARVQQLAEPVDAGHEPETEPERHGGQLGPIHPPIYETSRINKTTKSNTHLRALSRAGHENLNNYITGNANYFFTFYVRNSMFHVQLYNIETIIRRDFVPPVSRRHNMIGTHHRGSSETRKSPASACCVGEAARPFHSVTLSRPVSTSGVWCSITVHNSRCGSLQDVTSTQVIKDRSYGTK